ncbi:MAG TPA: hypothetical protein VGS41_19575, partial [Chthonomonadales bacterium]|nr:hypothetical protein [Chthonomonadales bacterium]
LLTPDINGSYVNGTWSQAANLPTGYAPLYYASAVLADGRVIIVGGEYNGGVQNWTKRAAIYNPLLNRWTGIPGPSGWNNIGDAQCCVLPDESFLLANPFDTRIADWNPATGVWTAVGAGKADANDEEGWNLLPDGTVLTVDAVNTPNAEKYIPSTQTWVSASSTPNSLVDPTSLEIGPAVLRPDGTVFAMGGTQYTAIYTPPASPTLPGTWAAGPNFPIIGGAQYDIADGPACLLPNGKVLCAASPGVYNLPLHFLIFNGSTLSPIAGTPNSPNDSSYYGRMLLLPTGQVLFTDGSTDVEVFTPAGSAQAVWAPAISSTPTALYPGKSYVLQGTQLNGLSQAVAYGDDATAATNYPIVRLKNLATGHIFYCRTYNHSTMAVATGSTVVSTHFTVPTDAEIGPANLIVVANGIPSAPKRVTVGPNITGLSPSSALAGGSAFTLTVFGNLFANGAVVYWNGAARATTFISAGKVTASILASDIASPGTASVTVTNPDTLTSQPKSFTIH